MLLFFVLFTVSYTATGSRQLVYFDGDLNSIQEKYRRKKYPIFNNYSPKAKWLPVNIHRDEVEVNIHRNHWAWGE
jgi:hypothetical protein